MKRILAAVLAALLAVTACGEAAPQLGPDLEAGRDTYRQRCATCHGGNGDGGAGPPLAEVTVTFSDCADQIQWISMGSDQFQAEVGPVYGDQGKEITAVMPQFSNSLTEEEIARVAAFERHQFAGVGESEALDQCGLGE